MGKGQIFLQMAMSSLGLTHLVGQMDLVLIDGKMEPHMLVISKTGTNMVMENGRKTSDLIVTTMMDSF